jgi:hypothetical protein
MKRNLIVLSNQSSPLRTALEGVHSLSSDYIIQESARTTQVDPENVLFIDANSFAESKIISLAPVKTALHKGIPIVITGASSTLLTALTGFGVEGTRAVIIVKGNGRIFYSKTFMVSDSSAESLGTESMLIPEDRRGEDRTDNISVAKDIHPVVSLVEYDLPQSVIEDLGKLDEVESILENLAKSSWNDESIPENRKWHHYWEPCWQSVQLTDPSYEQKDRKQNPNFMCSCTFRLIAADDPVKKKVFKVSVGGTGFAPCIDGETLIRYDTHHRGWAQSLTYVEFEPTGNEFGYIEMHLPTNTATEVSVMTQHTWGATFSGGGSAEGPEGSLSFTYQDSTGSTINSTDFSTSIERKGEAGMRFYHNAHVVGGDTFVDPIDFGFFGMGNNPYTSLTNSSDRWTDEMYKMFYKHNAFANHLVRTWPSLSLNLLSPGAECVWYADWTETREGKMKFGAAQGLNYFWHKYSVYNCASYLHKVDCQYTVDLNRVDYDDPVK